MFSAVGRSAGVFPTQSVLPLPVSVGSTLTISPHIYESRVLN